MKCKVCGRELDPNKKYCDKCGSFVTEADDVNESEFSWNTIDFPKPRKIQDIDMSWPEMEKKKEDSYMKADATEGFVSHVDKPEPQEEEKPAEPTPAPAQPQMQQPQMQTAQPMYQQPMSWTMPATPWAIPQQQQVVIPQPYNAPQPQPIPTTPTISPMPQPVYVQPMPLYVTQPIPVIQQPQVASQDLSMTIPEIVKQTLAQITKPTVPAREPINLDSWLDEQLEEAPSKNKDEFFTFYKKNEDFQKLLDQEYERYKSRFNTNATSLNLQIEKERQDRLKAKSRDVEATPSKENGNLFDSEAHLSDFDRMLLEGTKVVDEGGDSTVAMSNDQLKKEINEVAQKVEQAYKPITNREYDENKREKDLEDMAAARAAFLKPETEKEDLDKTSALEIKSIFDEWDKERQKADKKKKKKKKGGFGKFIFIIILLAAIFAAADFACMSLLPDSPVCDFFYTVNDKLSETYETILEKIGGEKEPEPAIELTPQEKAASDVNTNIDKLTCDVDASKFNSEGKYGFANIGSMTVVSDEDTIIKVTQLLVKYNCSWIDYVNSGTDIACFDYLKADGEAFRAASSFDGVGKVKETFKKLNIGEVRKDSKYIYVFADEYISVKKGSDITEVPSRLIYKLELVGDEYKIVEYDQYS